MKRCFECGREYNDETVSFCVDDGSELLFGPRSLYEPQTAVLHDTDAAAPQSTGKGIHTTDRTQELPTAFLRRGSLSRGIRAKHL